MVILILSKDTRESHLKQVFCFCLTLYKAIGKSYSCEIQCNVFFLRSGNINLVKSKVVVTIS